MTTQTTNGGSSITVSIYVGGVQVTNSPRTIQFPTAALIDSGYPFYLGTQAANISVNGSQEITVEWNTTGGTATALNRTLTAMKVG